MKIKKLNRLGRLNLITSSILVIVCLFWLYPFVWPIFSAFKSSGEMFRAGWRLWPEVWTLDNFVRAWSKAQFNRYLINSILYAVCSTSISVGVSALAGYVLARYKFPGSRALQLLVMGMIFLPTATSILPVFDLMQKLHLLNTPYAIILALSGGVGFAAILFQGYFRNIPQDMYDAAMVDGANFFQQFWLVLPLARPIIATNVIMGFNAAWQDYFTPLVFTLGKPELRTLSVGLRAFTGQYTVDISGFAAATTISILPIIIVFIIFQRQFVNGLAGAVKG
ncbi:MAG TPA: carbohydrate ABC transporter permease [Anaerolineaceae bacterium]|jgi:raffinose/stachyose/melibiose transport system permease protein